MIDLSKSYIENNPSKRPTSELIKPLFVTIHSENKSVSESDADLKASNNKANYSWHTSVGYDTASALIPFTEKAYCAMHESDKSLGIMMCTKTPTDVSIEVVYNRTADLAAQMLAKYNLTTAALRRHCDWDVTSNCPQDFKELGAWESFRSKVEAKLSSYDTDTDLVGSENEGINIKYDTAKTIFEKTSYGKNKVGVVKAILIQSSTKGSAVSCFSNIDFQEVNQAPIRPAHFAIDNKDVVKYIPSTTNALYEYKEHTDLGKQLMNYKVKEENPTAKTFVDNLFGTTVETETVVTAKTDYDHVGNYCIVVEMVDTGDLPNVEKNLIQFLTYYLRKHNLTEQNIWRSGDMIADFEQLEYYKEDDEFQRLIKEVGNCLKNTNKLCGATARNPVPRKWTPESRKLKVIKNTTLSDTPAMTEEDFITISGDSSVIMKSRFDINDQKQEFVKMEKSLYEPIYPDLTVPPRNATSLYQEGVMDSRDILDILTVEEQKRILKETEENKDVVDKSDHEDSLFLKNVPDDEKRRKNQKPVIGKIPNLFDAYPVDDKIAQLEKHAPMVTLEYENATEIANNLSFYMVNRFINTEKRLVQLENIMTAQMRMINRMSSRIEVNCVYYGGQSVHDKYKCIRCLSDDLTNDAAIVSLDQCLNCSRYEPVIGQTYEIMSEEAAPSKANIYDDIQASYMTKEDYVELTRIEEENKEDSRPSIDITKTHERHRTDQSYDTLLEFANNFVMNWEHTTLEYQSPHINIYEYDFAKIGLDKEVRLDPANKYEDGWRDLEQVKHERPDYGTTTLGGGGFGGSTFGNSAAGSFGVDDFDMAEDDIRRKILDFAKRATDLGTEKRFQYSLGAKIKYRDKTPEQLIELVAQGEKPFNMASGYSETASDIPAVHTDCSNFTNYIYYLASDGKLDIPGTTAQLKQASNDFEFIVGEGNSPKDRQAHALTLAIPGDLILYDGHVVIYAGQDEAYEAYGDSNDKTKEVTKNTIKTRTDFVAILRHKSLSVPKLKSVQYVNVKETLNSFVVNYQCRDSQNTKDGQDHNFTKDATLIKSYVDPTVRMTEELRLQFMDINMNLPDGMITASMIDAYIAKKKRTASMPRGEVFIEAGKKSGINPLWLVVHCAQETGWATSSWMTGERKCIIVENGQEVRHSLYNAYGIMCYNTDDERKAATNYAAEQKWFSKEAAVIGGAVWIYDTYLSSTGIGKHGRRDTTYFMKWHMGTTLEGVNKTDTEPGKMQYSSDITWPDQRSRMLHQLVSCHPEKKKILESLRYIIPKFK